MDSGCLKKAWKDIGWHTHAVPVFRKPGLGGAAGIQMAGSNGWLGDWWDESVPDESMNVSLLRNGIPGTKGMDHWCWDVGPCVRERGTP